LTRPAARGVIAANRGVAPETMRSQIKSIDAKLGVNWREQLELRLADEGRRRAFGAMFM
jgi:DNA-binding CsgD family transcriptional regulator